MLKALQMVQEELGADAIVISTREIPTGPSWNPWKHSAVEVVAARPEVLPDNKNTTTRVTKKPSGKTPVLRPAANKQGVEFVEEVPEIEWVGEPEEKPVSPPNIAISRQHKKPASTPRKWASSGDDEKNASKVEEHVERGHSVPTPQTPVIVPGPARSTPVSKKMVAPKMDLAEKDLPAGLKKINQQLNNQGVDVSLVSGLMNVALETLSAGTLADYETSKKYITQLMGAELRVQQGLGAYIPSNVICLIGASGSGKTSVLAKLALFFGQKLNKNIIWVCADTVRMGAIAEARAYTDALGLTLKLVYRPEDLKEILASVKETDLLLLDTPGYNPCSESQMVELGAMLVEIPKRFTYLVAPATTKEADLFQLSSSLGVFNLDGLIITKLDETHTFGSVYNFSRKNQIPLGFFTTGKETARNLEVVDPTRLVSALFGKVWNK